MRIPEKSRAEHDEERCHKSSLLRDIVGVSCDHFAHETVVCTLSTLRHFDSLVPGMVNYGPLIPWERRLAKMEISEFQEVTFGPRFEI